MSLTTHDDVSPPARGAYLVDAAVAGEECVGPPGKRARLDDSVVLTTLRRQVEYYLCDTNLETDEFLYDKIDTDGSIAATWLLGCPKVQDMGESRGSPITEEDMVLALEASATLVGEWRTPPPEQEGGERSLSVRRPLPLPAIRRSGWLAQQIQARRKQTPASEGAADADSSAPTGEHGQAAVEGAPASSAIKAGDNVRVKADGAVGTVIALDDSEVTVLSGDGDVLVVSREDLDLDLQKLQ